MPSSLHFRNLAAHALDLVFPPRCLACGGDVDRMGAVCGVCWKGLTFITDPLCKCCGLPFDFDAGPDSVCGACAGSKPPYDHARAALAYDAASRPLLLGLKHDRLHGVPTLAGWMLRNGGVVIAGADMICGVPLHRWRLLKRSYNQASLLGEAVGKLTGIATIPDLLWRHRQTVSQGGLSRSGRQRNVRGAFSLNPRWSDRVRDKHIVLVDDVFTTGATLAECCRVLRRAGAARIDVLCVARVIGPRL